MLEEGVSKCDLSVSESLRKNEIFARHIKIMLSPFSTQIEVHLPWHRRRQRLRNRCPTRECQRTQDDISVGQQTHAPRQSQAVQKNLIQPGLVFLIRLAGLNPRPNLAQQSLGCLGGEWQQAGQTFVLRRRKAELSRTLGSLPTAEAERTTRRNTIEVNRRSHVPRR